MNQLMRIITRQQLANSAAQRFRRDQRKHGWTGIMSRCQAVPAERVAAAMIKLGDTPDPDAIDELWHHTTREHCTECKQWGDGPWILLGDEPDYDSDTAIICPDCLGKAAAEMRKAFRPRKPTPPAPPPKK